MTGSATRTNQVPVLVAGRVGGTAPVASMALLVATPSSHAESEPIWTIVAIGPVTATSASAVVRQAWLKDA